MTIFFGQLFLPTNCYAHLFWGQLEAAAGRQSEAAEYFFCRKNLAKNYTSKNYLTIFFGQLFLPTNCYAHLFWGQLEAAAGRQSEAAEYFLPKKFSQKLHI